jgi:tetratricopeptide (TPR) repeat protein
MYFYHSWAIRILGGQWTDHQAFYGLPGYAFLLALTYLIVGIQPFVVGLLQAAVEAFTDVIIYHLGNESFASVRTPLPTGSRMVENQGIGLLAGLGWALFLPAQAFSVILMPTCWLVLAFWGCLLWLTRVRADSPWKPWLAMGAVIGFVAVFVATILFLCPIALASICRNVGQKRPLTRRWLSRAAAAGVLTAGIFAGTSPAWIHNWFVAHEPVMLSAHSGLNLWMGNNPFATGYPRIPDGMRASQDGLLHDSVTVAKKLSGKDLTRAEVSKFWSDRAKQWIRENRGGWFRLLGTKFSNFWNSLQYDDLSIIELLKVDGVLTPGIRFGLVSALGMAGLLLGIVRVPGSRWIAAGILFHMAALMPVFITERYRLCAVPGLLLFSAYLLVAFWQSLMLRHWGVVSAIVMLTAGSACFVTLPRADPANWSLDHYKAGIYFLEGGKLSDAECELTTAFAYVPSNSEILFALGNLRLTQKNNNSAKHWYRKSLELQPNHPGAWNNAGVIALEEKRWDIAERAFMKSLQSDPDDAKTYYLLARARLELGNRQGALAAIEEAVRRAPRQNLFLELRQQIIEGKPAPR